MNYEETLAHIFSRGRFGIRPGLERIRRLLELLGNPHEHVPAIHIAGTNGKGSTASFLASILQSSGLKTALFTSPHLTSFTERFRINGTPVAEERLEKVARAVLDAAPPEATFFELVTAMGFSCFAGERVDVAVIETGMGGRWDATNVVSPLVSVITPVSLDHCEYLGASIEEIAAEKAGIIKPGHPAVIAPQPEAAAAVIERRCGETGSEIFRFGQEFTATWTEGGVEYRGSSLSLRGVRPGIGGRYQLVNCACAVAAAEQLMRQGLPLSGERVRAGIERAQWPGRMELLPGPPSILLDGAHNRAGTEALAAELSCIPHQRVLMIAGVMGEKDADCLLSPLFPQVHHVYAVSPRLERAMPSDELARACRLAGVACSDAGTVAAGLAAAREAATSGDLVLVCGSLFTVGEARSILLNRTFQPIRG